MTRLPSLRRRVRTIAVVAAALGGVFTAGATAAQVTVDEPVTAVLQARVGERVPNITLPDLEGVPRSLTELRGQRAMLHVFASW